MVMLTKVLLPVVWMVELSHFANALKCHQRYQYFSKSSAKWKDYPYAHRYFNSTFHGDTCETESGDCVTALISSVDHNLRGERRPQTELHVTLEMCCEPDSPCAAHDLLALLHHQTHTGATWRMNANEEHRRCSGRRDDDVAYDYAVHCGTLLSAKRRQGKIAISKCSHVDLCSVVDKRDPDIDWTPTKCTLLRNDEICEAI